MLILHLSLFINSSSCIKIFYVSYNFKDPCDTMSWCSGAQLRVFWLCKAVTSSISSFTIWLTLCQASTVRLWFVLSIYEAATLSTTWLQLTTWPILSVYRGVSLSSCWQPVHHLTLTTWVVVQLSVWGGKRDWAALPLYWPVPGRPAAGETGAPLQRLQRFIQGHHNIASVAYTEL